MHEALKKIEKNKYGFILTSTSKGKINGIATDGDIRRYLIGGGNLSDTISNCVNHDFVFESPKTSREKLIKRLDHRIRVIPILNENFELVDIVSRNHIPIQSEEAVYARSRSPVRISFGGGGSDLTDYFSKDNGAVISSTISLYSHATLKVRPDQKIFISSNDLNKSIQGNNLDEILKKKNNFSLIQSILAIINPTFGFELFLYSDYPMNSGLGGSAAITAAILGCFNEFRQDKWDSHELAEIAFEAERLRMGVLGGWQDQYATVFGGFNFIEFQYEQNIVHPLRIHPDILMELEESLVLCNTGLVHSSHEIHNDQKINMKSKSFESLLKKQVELSYRMRNQLLRGRLIDFGHSLHEAWEAKKLFSSKISNAIIDQIYLDALSNGAIGGKLLGAGGGGFFIFYCPPFHKLKLLEYLDRNQFSVIPFIFESQGLRSSTIREKNTNINF